MPLVYSKRVESKVYPPDAVYVGRPTKFGNQFIVGKDGDQTFCATEYYLWLLNTKEGQEMAQVAREELSGKDLICWCVDGIDDSGPLLCHAQALMKVANSQPDKE